MRTKTNKKLTLIANKKLTLIGILDAYSTRIETVRVYLKGGIPGMKGRILKSKGKYYITTTTSHMRVRPEEISRILDKNKRSIRMRTK